MSRTERCPHFRGKFASRKHIWDTAETEVSLFQGRPLRGVPLYTQVSDIHLDAPPDKVETWRHQPVEECQQQLLVLLAQDGGQGCEPGEEGGGGGEEGGEGTEPSGRLAGKSFPSPFDGVLRNNRIQLLC